MKLCQTAVCCAIEAERIVMQFHIPVRTEDAFNRAGAAMGEKDMNENAMMVTAR